MHVPLLLCFSIVSSSPPPDVVLCEILNHLVFLLSSLPSFPPSFSSSPLVSFFSFCRYYDGEYRDKYNGGGRKRKGEGRKVAGNCMNCCTQRISQPREKKREKQ